MTGGEPPHAPSRSPYPPWQGRGYRRRGGGPGGAGRNSWAPRRPRSPPPPSPMRPRHSRGMPPKHLRHPSLHPPPLQPHSNSYHPPPAPLSRSLQSRLRPSSRSPPRRSEGPPVRSDQHSYRGEQHPYRGEPGPPHRVEPSDRGSYRASDSVDQGSYRGNDYDYAPQRGPLANSRGETSLYRSEQMSHRSSGEHHVPYRGEPGPLYRADGASLRDDVDSRRSTADSHGRSDSQPAYGSWFRNPAKIHKPLVKPKKRRMLTHVIGQSRLPAQSFMKPESPILSRVGFSPAERPTGSRIDNAPSSAQFSTKPLSSIGHDSSMRWQSESAAKVGSSISPRVSNQDEDVGNRGDYGGRNQALSGGTEPPRRLSNYRDQQMNPIMRTSELRMESQSMKSGDGAYGGSKFGATRPSSLGRPIHERGPMKMDSGNQSSARNSVSGGWRVAESRPGASVGRDDLTSSRVPSPRKEKSPVDQRHDSSLHSRPGGVASSQVDARQHLTAMRRNDVPLRGRREFNTAFDRNGPSSSGVSLSKPAGVRAKSMNDIAPQSSTMVRSEPKPIASFDRVGRATGRESFKKIADSEVMKQKRPVETSVPAMERQSEPQGRVAPARLGSSGGSADLVTLKQTSKAPSQQAVDALRKETKVGRAEVSDLGRRDKGKKEGQDPLAKAVSIEPEGVQNGKGSSRKSTEVSDKGALKDKSSVVDLKKVQDESVKQSIVPPASRPEENAARENVVDTKGAGANEVRRGENKQDVASQAKVQYDPQKPVDRGSEPIIRKASPVNNSQTALQESQKTPQPKGEHPKPVTIAHTEIEPFGKEESGTKLQGQNKSEEFSTPKATAMRKVELRSVLSSLKIPSSVPVPRKDEVNAVKTPRNTEARIDEKREEKAGLERPSVGTANGEMDVVPQTKASSKTEPSKLKRPASLDLRAVLSSTLSLASTPILRESKLATEKESADVSKVDALTLSEQSKVEVKSEIKDDPRKHLSVPPNLSEKGEAEEVDDKREKLVVARERDGDVVMTSTPVAVPLPALSLLRSSPKPRANDESPVKEDKSVAEKGVKYAMAPSSEPMDLKPQSDVKKETDSLVQQIHQLDGEIASLERKLAQAKASKSADQKEVKRRPKSKKEPECVRNAAVDCNEVSQLALSIASRGDQSKRVSARRSFDSTHGALRLLLVQNQSRAAAASAALRSVCHDTELGLSADRHPIDIEDLQISEELRIIMAQEIFRRRSLALDKRKKLSSEYRELRRDWVRRLKLAKDKRSKEKREATKERDRFLVLHTKGQNARLSSRTSSGRMSTKIFPTLNASGVFNGTADADALLADIAAEGGTPGSRDIWSKTLAEVPDQDSSRIPADCASVLVEDPMADFHASRAVNPWQFHERLIFLDKYLTYQKNFRKIAAFLEHKSPRDCSYFYYLNKLHLGLKQLTKEASTLKRKGLLRAHLVTLAKKRLSCESEEYISSQVNAFLAKAQIGSVSYASHRPLPANDGNSVLGVGGNTHLPPEKKHVLHMNMMLKKKIVSENVSLDLSDIDRDTFAQALLKFGTDWKEVASFMSLPNKSCSHFREYYRRNRRKLRMEDLEKFSHSKAATPLRSPGVSLRQSPRASPRSSPYAGLAIEQQKLSRSPEHGEVEPMFLANGEGRNGLKRPQKSGSPVLRGTGTNQAASGDNALKEPERPTASPNDFETRKSKTSTWTVEEGETFKQLFRTHGRDWKKIAQLMPPKTPTQVKGYWRTVAHEVGNGLPSESARKRKSRRSASNEGLYAQHSRDQEERRSSPRESSGATAVGKQK